MSTALIIITIIIVTIILFHQIQMISSRQEGITKEIRQLREKLEHLQTSGQNPDYNPAVYQDISQSKNKKEILIQPQKETAGNPSSEPSAQPLPTPPIVKKQKRNYEKVIGENLFGKIGILILVAGIGLFVKYAIDNQWINETMRTILGFSAGAGLLLLAQKLHKKYRTFSSLLAGGGFALFYVTTVIAYHYYALFSQTATFLSLVIFTILMSALAFISDRKELAVIALTGGFLAPFLVSNGSGNYIALFSYILILNSGMFILSIYKKWGELPLISFGLTWICLLVYLLNTQSLQYSSVALLSFSSGFFLQFLLPFIFIVKNSPHWLNKTLTGLFILNNFVFLGFGLYFLDHIHTDIKLNGLLPLSIAIVNSIILLWQKKRLIHNRTLYDLILALIIVFISLFIPLQLDGNFITVFWASEMVLLLYLSIRSGFKIYEYFSYAIAILVVISWQTDSPQAKLLFFNGYFSSSLFTAASFLTYAWLLEKYKLAVQINTKFYNPVNIFFLLISCLLFWESVNTELDYHINSYKFSNILKNIFSGGYLLLLNFLLRKRFPIQRYSLFYVIALGLNSLIFIFAYVSLHEEWLNPSNILLFWSYWLIITIHIFSTARAYFSVNSFRAKEQEWSIIALNAITSLFLIVAVCTMLQQFHLSFSYCSAGITVCLTILGFIQMNLGMRLHLKLLRQISLTTLGLILAKLLISDLWLLPAIGKIIVFVILGIILLLLSFMYQKLKNVLFKDNHDPDQSAL